MTVRTDIYGESRPAPTRPSALLIHTKLYVLADRFNIILLRDFTYSKITTLLAELGKAIDNEQATEVMTAITYAFDNLLYSSGPSKEIDKGPTEKLLSYLALYTSWALDVVRENDVFLASLGNSPDFARAVCLSSKAAEAPPWAPERAIKATPIVEVKFSGYYESLHVRRRVR